MVKKPEKIEMHFLENLKILFKLIKGQKLIFYLMIVLALFIEILMIADNLLIKWLVDYGEAYGLGEYLAEEVMEIFISILLVFFILVIFRAAIRYFNLGLRNKLMANIESNAKSKYLNHIINLDYNFHTKNKSGELISKLTRGTSAATNLVELVTQRLFGPFISLFVVLFSIAYFDLVPALITVGTGAIILIFSWIIFAHQADKKLIYNKENDLEKGFIGNILTNFESVKLFGKEDSIKRKYGGFVNKTKKSFLIFNDYYKLYSFLMSLTLGIGTILLLYFSLKSFLIGAITLGTVIFIFSTYGRMISPIVGLSDALRRFNESMSDIQALFEYEKIENEIKDDSNAGILKIKRGSIEFRNVNFGYNKKEIFKGLNLKIKPLEKVAIIGASGGGKTSLVRLLFRLYDVLEGVILVDDKNIKKVKQNSLRREMSIVPQEPILFHDTIYNNIKFANPSSSKKEVMNAIKKASLKEFIENLPERENTQVGERGIKLSGGEKQRIAIARALLANKKILVLDEPTSSLDLDTEHKIQKSIYNLLKDKTAIIIAHRLTTIRNSDRIIVLKGGKIIEQGKHEELLKRKGEYNRLWNLQEQGIIK